MSSDTETISQLRPIDLPLIPINFDCDSSDNIVDEDSTGLSRPSTPGSPCTSVTSATPMAQLASSVTSFGFSESDTAPFAVPQKKRRFTKKRRGFQKGDAHPKRRLFAPESPNINMKRESMSPNIKCNFPIPKRPVPYSISLKKDEQLTSRTLTVPHGSEIMNMDILCHVVSMLRCNDPACTGNLVLHKTIKSKGLHSSFILHCRRCHQVVAEFSSSLHIGESPKAAVNCPPTKASPPTEVNSRAMLAVHSTSISWRDFLLLCAVMDLPVPGRNMNKHSLSNFTSSAVEVCQDSMSLAASQVRARETTPESNIPGAFRCDVSFDATWHRRGHYSNQGFGAAIDVVSNKVLDYMLFQRVCRKCLTWPLERRSNFPEEFAAFCAEHEATCSANFSGTSEGMEGSAAIEIWKRSVDRNQLVYSTYVGDGDSSSFKNLYKSDPYKGVELVRKEECLGHVQKRLKKHLKNKSNSFSKISAGKVERIGQLYALVVAQNRGKTPEEIQTALWNLLEHLVENHVNCPFTTDSWCYYQAALAENSNDPSFSIPPLRQAYLNDSEYGRTKEVFSTFASLSMCGALTMAQTQNANESLHSIIWHHSPKAKYVGQKSIEASTALAVSTFNGGEMALASVLHAMSITPSYNTLLHFARRDRDRNLKRERAIIETQKRRRRQLTSRAITAESSRKRRAKAGPSLYSSGKYGTEVTHAEDNSGDESDTTCEICKKRACPLGRKRRVDGWVGCEICECWFHSRCAGVTSKSLGDEPFFCETCS